MPLLAGLPFVLLHVLLVGRGGYEDWRLARFRALGALPVRVPPPPLGSLR